MSDTHELDVVTGAFGYTGKYITRRLLNAGRRVRTITGHPKRANSFGNQVEIAPMDFSDRAGLVRSLRGASVLYNTYWVRFNHGRATFDEAVANSRVLIEAAREAGRPQDRASQHRQSFARFAPSVLFGQSAGRKSDRGFRTCPTPSSGPRSSSVSKIFSSTISRGSRAISRICNSRDPDNIELQPIFVEDLAELATSSARQENSLVLDAVGPEIFAFEDLVRQIALAVGAKPRFIHVSPRVALQMLRLVGPIVGDVILTREEIEGLMANLLVSKHPATGQTRFTAWLCSKCHRHWVHNTPRNFRGITDDSREPSVPRSD